MRFTVRYFDPPARRGGAKSASRPSRKLALRAQLAGRRARCSSLEQCAARPRRRLRHVRACRVRRRRGGVASCARCCAAGMTVVEALETLHAQAPATARGDRCMRRCCGSLREGQSLSRAMRSAGVFPTVLVASVTASERTSTLVAGARRLPALRRNAGARCASQVVSAAIYPAVVVGARRADRAVPAAVRDPALLAHVRRLSRRGEPADAACCCGVSRHAARPVAAGRAALVAWSCLLVWAWRSGALRAAALVRLLDAHRAAAARNGTISGWPSCTSRWR